MNEKLQAQLKILKLSDAKPNFSELSREYHYDRRTIKKYYDGYEGKPKSRVKKSKLDPYRDIITEKLALKGTSIRSVYEYLVDTYGESVGTYENLYIYIRSRNLRPMKKQLGHPRYETKPGYQAQVDWKEDVSLLNKYGEQFTVQVFDYKLGYSRYCHFVLRITKTQQDVFDCLIESFQQCGGVPSEILFDNMPSLVHWDGNKRIVSIKAKMFADDFGFKMRFAKPRSPETKGKVETINKFVEWLQPYNGEFSTLEDLELILKRINKKVNSKICQATSVAPLLLFQNEKEHLQTLPRKEIIESYLTHDRKILVQSDSLIPFRNSKYSVPPAYIGKQVSVQLTETNELVIYYNTERIAVHKISEKKLNYIKEHYIALLSSTLPHMDGITEMAEMNLKQMDALL